MSCIHRRLDKNTSQFVIGSLQRLGESGLSKRANQSVGLILRSFARKVRKNVSDLKARLNWSTPKKNFCWTHSLCMQSTEPFNMSLSFSSLPETTHILSNYKSAAKQVQQAPSAFVLSFTFVETLMLHWTPGWEYIRRWNQLTVSRSTQKNGAVVTAWCHLFCISPAYLQTGRCFSSELHNRPCFSFLGAPAAMFLQLKRFSVLPKHAEHTS